MQRRQFLQAGVTLAAGVQGLSRFAGCETSEWSARAPAYSVIPVVGDGRWIWTRPPQDSTGYLEPRTYDLKVGIELEGTGSAEEILSTTTVPLDYPEQKIESVRIETQGCEAEIRQLTSGAGQLMLAASGIVAGQVISAVAHYQLTLYKQYQGYQRDQFPVRQDVPGDVRRGFLQDSPGIQTKSKPVRDLAAELSHGTDKHPWSLTQKFAAWVIKNIKPQIGNYTSVTAALESHRGDCEEMACVFVALCRTVSIPARLVWVPNHTWAEFFLVDEKNQGHWIPAHTACYPWFGWNGAHELVLQKGDRVQIPERHKQVRLLEDWARWSGKQPKLRCTAEMTPLPPTAGGDAGPGARRKNEQGEWKVVGNHPLDKYIRR
jgi:hypothetical protein